MISISTDLSNAINNSARTIKTRLYFDNADDYVENGVISVTLTESGFSGNSLTVGEFNSNSIQVAMYQDDTISLYEGTSVRVEQAILVGDEYQTINMGTYYIEEIERSDGSIYVNFIAYDKSFYLNETYVPTIDFPTTDAKILSDICSQYGLTYTGITPLGITFNEYYNETALKYISYIAQFQCKNVRINRDEIMEFYWWSDSGYTITRDLQAMAGYKVKSDNDFVVYGVSGGSITEYDDEGNESTTTLISGSGTIGVVSFTNPYMTQTYIDSIYNKIVNFEYSPCTISYRGNPALEIGDIVHVEDSEGNVHTVLLGTHTLVLTGMKGTIDCTASTGTIEENTLSPTDAKISSVYSYVERSYTKTAEIEQLYATKASITDLNAQVAEINKAYITTADVETLLNEKAYINEANIATVIAELGYIDEANIEKLIVSYGYVDTEYINTLMANYIDADTIKSEYVTTDHLESNYIDADTIATDYIKADLTNFTVAMVGKLLADSGLVTNMTIDNGYVTGELSSVTINADTITTGTLSVERLLLVGADGLIYQINAQSGGLTETQLTDEVYQNYIDGSVLVAKSVTADQVAAGTLTANEIDVNDIFAQDITATGTITGANLKGATVQANTLTYNGNVVATRNYVNGLLDEINETIASINLLYNQLELQVTNLSNLSGEINTTELADYTGDYVPTNYNQPAYSWFTFDVCSDDIYCSDDLICGSNTYDNYANTIFKNSMYNTYYMFELDSETNTYSWRQLTSQEIIDLAESYNGIVISDDLIRIISSWNGVTTKLDVSSNGIIASDGKLMCC